MTRTGIFGGSFNPIHLGHTALAQTIVASGHVDEVWLMVSPHNPLKQRAGLLPDDLRLELARLATAGLPHVEASDFEFHLPRPSFMVNTLQRLAEAWPDREFVLVIGADNWLVFDQWRDHQTILARHRVLVYPREGFPVDADGLPDGVTLLDTPIYPVSSTEIRQSLAAGTVPTEWLAPKVQERLARHLPGLKFLAAP